jgi:hypothetical protein
MQAQAIKAKDGNGVQIGMADTAFNYLQGDWVQSYRANIYFIPFCETACYPHFNSCYADYFKFELDPFIPKTKRYHGGYHQSQGHKVLFCRAE